MNLLERARAIGITGFIHPNELEDLADLACGRDVLEIGSFCGLSAWGMAPVARTLICVDTFRAATDGQRQTGDVTTLHLFMRAVEPFANVSWTVATSEEAAGQVPGDFDLIFLDAMHTYDDVRADIERWWPRVRSGGVLALHDYGHDDFPGVKQAADELLGPPDPAQLAAISLVTLVWWAKP